MADFTGKNALVTGASRGIGRAVASRLAACGARVVVNYRSDEEGASSLVEQIRARGGEALAVQADVTDAAAATALVERSVTEFGRLDILVNNAGITRDNLLIRMSDQEWDEVLNLNLRAQFAVTRAAMRGMLRQRSGRVIFISSVVGIAGNSGQANYAASKAGVIGLAKSIAREVGSRGITVNVVAPGYIQTDMTAKLSEEIRERIVAQTVLKRLGEADDVAAAVSFLASDEAAFITGQVLNVDGGMVMA